MEHTFTFTFDAPDEAVGSTQVEIARQAAVQLLEQIQRVWPEFRKCAAREPGGRFWLHVGRRCKPPARDRLMVVSSECRAQTREAQIEEFQAVMRAAISEFDARYVGFTQTLFTMMRQEESLGLILKRLLRFRPLGEFERRRPPRMKFWRKYAHIPSN